MYMHGYIRMHIYAQYTDTTQTHMCIYTNYNEIEKQRELTLRNFKPLPLQVSLQPPQCEISKFPETDTACMDTIHVYT